MCKPAVVLCRRAPQPFSTFIWQIMKTNLIKPTKGLRNSSGKIMEVPRFDWHLNRCFVSPLFFFWFFLDPIYQACGSPIRISRGLALIACTMPHAMSVSGFQSCANIGIPESFEGCIHNPANRKVR